MTEFRALPVRCGDACTIRCRRGDYLFDGGIEGCDLGGMLTRRKFKRLRVAACTSIVRERIGGILDLLEAEYPIGDLWLPDGIRELTAAAVGFNGDWAGWVDSAGGHDVGLRPKGTAFTLEAAATGGCQGQPHSLSWGCTHVTNCPEV